MSRKVKWRFAMSGIIVSPYRMPVVVHDESLDEEWGTKCGVYNDAGAMNWFPLGLLDKSKIRPCKRCWDLEHG